GVVAARDDLEEEVGVAAVVREVADLVDAQELRDRVTPQATRKRDGGLLGGEVGEHVAGGGESDSVPAHDGLVRHVLEDHRLADAIGADEYGIVTGLDEGEREELVDGLAIDLLGPRPVEVGHRLERGDTGVSYAAFQAPLLALALLDGEYLRQPGLVGDLVAAGEQAEESERFEAILDLGGIEGGHASSLARAS